MSFVAQYILLIRLIRYYHVYCGDQPRTGWTAPSDDEWKHLQLLPSDAVTLINIRAVYVIQLLVTTAGATSENLKPMFHALGQRTTIQMLCDMDSCLLSFEGMLSCWQAALTDLLSCGRFDVKAVLKASDIKPVTSVAVKLFGGAVGEDGGDQKKSSSTTSYTEIADDDAALFSWTELISYGSDDLIPKADELLCLQSTLRSRLLETAREIEGDYRKRMCVYVEQTGHDGDDAGKKKRGHNSAGMKSTILFKLDAKDEVLKSPTDVNLLYYKLPKDLKLVFFGNVSHLARHWLQNMNTSV